MRRIVRPVVVLRAGPLFAALLMAQLPVSGQGNALPENKGFATIKQIIGTSCSDCHDWATSYEGIVDPARIVPFFPEKSLLYRKISDDGMPMAGAKLTPDQKALIRAWIAAGAGSSDAPITPAGAAAGGPAAAGAATASSEPASPPQTPSAAALGLPGFPGGVAIHEISGFTSAALFLAAAAVGTVHFLSLMEQGHAYAESIGFEEGGPEAVRSAEIMKLWNDPAEQTLRWWHVGLLAGGELFYSYNAVTGIGMWSGGQQPFSRQALHRDAFFVHAALMTAQIGLGFLESYALQQGMHDIEAAAGVAHVVVGYAIPVVILAGGLENIFGQP